MIDAPIESGLGEYLKMMESMKAIDYSGKLDEQLAEHMSRLTSFFGAGSSPSGDKHLLRKSEIELFALVREAARRAVGLKPFDVQLIAGMAMDRGCIADRRREDARGRFYGLSASAFRQRRSYIDIQ
jgi:preprotein translocase subunit SecA